MRVVNSTSPALLASPLSLPHESCYSWVQRICGAHQLSLRVVHQMASGSRSAGTRDWDLCGSGAAWDALVHLSGMGVDSCAEARSCMGYLARSGAIGRRPRGRLLVQDNHPASRWCPACFEHDEIPHLRWEWRLPGVTQCLRHGTPLLERCPWCKSALRLDRTLMVDSSVRAGVETIAQCSSCGMSLADRSGDLVSAHSALDKGSQAMLEVASGLRAAFNAGSGQLELDLGLRQQIQVIVAGRLQNQSTHRSIERHRPVVLDLRVRRIPDPNAAPLRICAATFISAHSWPIGEPTKKAHWTRKIAGQDRTRLAMALQLIRKQKAAWRAELASHRETD